VPVLPSPRPDTDLCPRPRATHAIWCAWLAGLLLAMLAVFPARAEGPEFTEFKVSRTDEGVLLDFALRFDLPRNVEDALQKGVPLYFVAEAEVFRSRWYWRDRQVARATRVWRLAFQPLTRKYRVTFGGLNQSYDTLGDALASVRRVADWKIVENGQIEEGERHYVEFSYRLDTTLLPRPMQIGIGGQPEWTLIVERDQRF
jgi:hypothetical protein